MKVIGSKREDFNFAAHCKCNVADFVFVFDSIALKNIGNKRNIDIAVRIVCPVRVTSK